MSENGLMDRPRRTTRSSLASSNTGTPQTPSSSSNPYKKPTYFSNSRQGTPASGGDTPASRNTNGTPVSSGRGRRGRGRPPGGGTRGSFSGRGGHHHHHHHVKPECIAVRVDGRRNTGGSTASSGGGGGRRGAASGGRRSTYNSRHDYEYHYGSDFESDNNESEPEEEPESEPESEGDSVSLGTGRDDNADSDTDYSVISSRVTASRLPSPPVPIWLDTDKVPEEPLNLPNSSEDLILSREHVVKAVEVYEPLRRFHQLVRLSPFRFEDFCGALASEDQSALLAEIHIQLLKCVIREEDANGTLFGPNEVKDSVQSVVYFLDHITWPESLRAYLESDPSWKEVHDALYSVEYPFCGPALRIKILGWLVDQFLTTSSVREHMLGDGTILHEDHCRACNRLGELICCERCPAVYHLQCVTPPLKDFDNPPDDWKCPVCMKHQIAGVNDCTTEDEKMGILIRHERLGYDRHGRKYWFLVRRILVESEDGSEVWYYSTRSQLEELLAALDGDNYESVLFGNIKAIEEEVFRQMEVTEEVTRTQNTQRRKTYLEVENGEKDIAEQERMTRLKSTGLYKLGQEGLFRTYINHFSSDPSALSKTKHNEERDRKRHMSHKFSLTTASECKWGIKDMIGCPRQTQIAALKGALTHMENVLPTTLMHVNWPMLRKQWLTSVQTGASAVDFAKAMLMISTCIRNAVYNPVWCESTGHVRLIRMSLIEREERKKAEKRDKKDKDDEEDRLKLLPQYVKYTIPIKHQVYKQKGEEYRIHGRWGWIWLSNMRRCKSQDCREVGLLAGPHKHVIQVKNETGKVKTMLIDPGVYSKLMAKRNLATSNVKQTSGIDGSSPIKDGELKNVSVPSSDSASAKHTGNDCANISRAESESSGKEEQGHVNESVEKNISHDVKMEEEEANKETEKSDDANSSTVELTEGDEKAKKAEQIEPKVEPMEIDGPPVGEIQEKNGDSEMKDDCTKNEDVEPTDPDSGIKMNDVMDVDESVSTETPETETEKDSAPEKEVDSANEDTPNLNGEIEKDDENSTKPSVETAQADAKVEDRVCVGNEKENGGADASSTPSSVPDEPSNVTSPPQIPPAQADPSKQGDDSQCRKFKTELVNVSSGLASAHRILYPKVARRCEYLDSLLGRRLTLMSYEEKQLKNTYGEEMVAKAKPGLAAFQEEETKKEQEAEEYPGEEIIDDGLTLAGAYTFKCYSSECRKEGQLFMTVKGKNRERTYEKICYSPMCRLKFCLQETTRFKQERMREAEKEKYIKVYNQIESSRVYTLEETSAKLYMKRLPDGVAIAGAAAPAAKKKKTPPIKYPQLSPFEYATSGDPSILVLPQYELRKLARTAGRLITPSGFFPNQKSGSWGWSYPCGRPIFRTAWQFKTTHARTLAAAAMQLRILYASIRWDDILAKIPNSEGRHQVHTDTEIITTEILNHRIVGRFMEKVQYLRKMMVVPIDAPKTIRAKSRESAEITPSRIGLRKRRRAESPDKTEPVVSEDWVDEERLELWEIRYYGDRIDRKHDRKSESNTPSTRTKSGIAIKQPEKYDPSHNPVPLATYPAASSSSHGERKTESTSDTVDKTIDSVIQNTASMKMEKSEKGQKTVSAVRTAELMRETIQTEMKMQRAVHLSKRDNHAKHNNSSTNPASHNKPAAPPQLPTASQQLQQQNAKAGLPTNPRNIAQVAISTPTSSKVGTAVVGKKFFVNKQNSMNSVASGQQNNGIDSHQTVTPSAGILSRKPLQSQITINKGVGGSISVVKNTPIQNTSPVVTSTPSLPVVNNGPQVTTTQLQQPLAQPQKLSVVRMQDGRLQVRGLLPGQHCYQTADGKIHVTVPATQVQQIQAASRPQTSMSAVAVASSSISSTTPLQQQQQQQQQSQHQTVIVQGGSAVVTHTTASTSTQVTNAVATPNIVVTSASQSAQQTIQVQHTASPVVSSQPLINISNPAMKTAISTSTSVPPANKPAIQQQTQQIIVQQPGGQQLIIQGTSAQALLQQQQKIQRIVQTSTSSNTAQFFKQLSAVSAGIKSPITVTSTATGSVTTPTTLSNTTTTGQITVPGRLVIQDGKALLISSSPGGATTHQQISEQILQQQQHRKVILNKQVIQNVSGQQGQQTIVRPQVIQTNPQGQIISGQPLQIIQTQGVSGQVHLIAQPAQTTQTVMLQQQQQPPKTLETPVSMAKVVSNISQITAPSSSAVSSITTATTQSPKVSVTGPSTALTTQTAVKHVLADGRTVILSPQQLTELTAGGGRKVILNKQVQVVPGSSTLRPQQQIIQTTGVSLATSQPTIQIVQGPGGHQFLIQQPSQALLQQAQQTQAQQQVQIVVPSGQLGGGQPLLVKKFVKTTPGTSTGVTSQQNKTGTAGQGGGGVVQISATAQNQLTQLLGSGKALVRLDNNQLTNIQLPSTGAVTSPVVNKSAIVTTPVSSQQQQTTTITRTPGLPISIVSPSKSKVQQQNSQKAPGTVQVITSTGGNATNVLSGVALGSTSSPMSTGISTAPSPVANQVLTTSTPTKSITPSTPTVVRVASPVSKVAAITLPMVRAGLPSVVAPRLVTPTTPTTPRPPTVPTTPISTLSPLKQPQVTGISTPGASNTVVITQNLGKPPSPTVPTSFPQPQTISPQPQQKAGVASTSGSPILPTTSVITSTPVVIKPPAVTTPVSLSNTSTKVVFTPPTTPTNSNPNAAVITQPVQQKIITPGSPVKIVTPAPSAPSPTKTTLTSTVAAGNALATAATVSTLPPLSTSPSASTASVPPSVVVSATHPVATTTTPAAPAVTATPASPAVTPTPATPVVDPATPVTTATSPVLTAATSTTTPAKSPVKSTPSKIVAQIFQTPQGPKVVIQGVTPGELTPAQMMQLQAQIQKQLAAQQQQQAQRTVTTSKAASPVVEAPKTPQVTAGGSPTKTKGTSPVSTSTATASQLVQSPVGKTELPSVQPPLFPPESQSAEKPCLEKSTEHHLVNVTSTVSTPNETEMQQLSPQMLRSSLHVRSPPPALVSPANALSSPGFPPVPSPLPKQVVGKHDLVAAVSSVTEPAILSPASQPPQLTPMLGNRLQQSGAQINANPAGLVVAKKSTPRKSPLKAIAETPILPSLISDSPPAVTNNANSNSTGFLPLNLEQQQLLANRRNALKQDIMEKKKAAATQMKLEAQREIQEKLEKVKAAELGNRAEEQKRMGPQLVHQPMHDLGHHARGSAKKRKSKDMEHTGSHRGSESVPTSRRGPKGAKRKRDLFCVCNTPYDNAKFYIGCDKCDNWFHGECVGITQAMSKDITEYICDGCRDDKLYCICRKPYNESQFYIQCDKCEEWLHGRCVGVLQGESDTIGDYSCPTCEPRSEINFPNSKKLDTTDYTSVSRLVKEMLQHRSSIPFRKPVTKAQAPNYFSVIKEPMDLQTISVRVEDKQYERLSDFIADVTKIFENCRYFNEPTTDIYRHADNLEKFFVQKIWALRQTFNTRLRQVI